MFKGSGDEIISTGVISGVLAKFLLTNREISLPEGFVYVMLGIIIVSYWSFQAWLRIAEKDRLRRPEIESELQGFSNRLTEVAEQNGELSKQIDSQNSRINALLLRIGLK